MDGEHVGRSDGVGEEPVPETTEAGACHKEVHNIFNSGAEWTNVGVKATMAMQAFPRSGPSQAQKTEGELDFGRCKVVPVGVGERRGRSRGRV